MTKVNSKAKIFQDLWILAFRGKQNCFPKLPISLTSAHIQFYASLGTISIPYPWWTDGYTIERSSSNGSNGPKTFGHVVVCWADGDDFAS